MNDSFVFTKNDVDIADIVSKRKQYSEYEEIVLNRLHKEVKRVFGRNVTITNYEVELYDELTADLMCGINVYLVDGTKFHIGYTSANGIIDTWMVYDGKKVVDMLLDHMFVNTLEVIESLYTVYGMIL